jgi:hypothetical protein
MTRALALGGLMIALSAGTVPAAVPDGSWLRGYRRSIAGETIDYHSPYPDTTSALLVRATDGRMTIEWETDPAPETIDQPFVTFVWMAGLATRKGAHVFSLLADGEPLLDFRSGADAAPRAWEVEGREGSRLAFRATMVDQFDELFGFMWLRLPRGRVRPGAPVRLKAVGENGGSSDWFMVFEDTLAPGVTIAAEEALVRRDAGRRQLVRVEVSHIAPPCGVEIAAGGDRRRETLEVGYNVFHLEVDAVAGPTDVPVTVAVDGRPSQEGVARLRPVPPRELWLLPHSHVDIGYSDRQEAVERHHWRYFEEAIDLARRTEGLPDGARFRWNVEVLWAADTYLRQASAGKRAAFLEAVRRGWIGLQALPANLLTGICHPEELFRALEPAGRLGREAGVAVDAAMITDIPSYSWSLVPALAQSGVRHLSSGPNYMPALPDGGDRIGHAMKAWADRPFYWVSPSGEERVLLWMAGRGYSWFHGLHMGPLRLEKQRPILDYVRRLTDAGYPYSMVQVRYTIGGDNGPPDPRLPEVVRAWNEEFESPRLVIATASRMFEEFERRHGPEVPEVRGDFTPYWEDGAASTARETALNRRTAARLLQAETLWAMLAPADCPADEFREAWRQVVLFDEHTWGAAESVTDPDGDNARAQWAWKEAVAREGRRRADLLWQAALDRRGGPATGAAFEVINTSSWPRTEVVRVPRELSAGGDRVRDAAGRDAPSQRLAGGELAVLVSDLPPLGSRRYTVGSGAAFPSGSAQGDAAAGRLEDERMSLSINPRTGAIASLRWMPRGVELVDREHGTGLNEYRYVPGRDPAAALGVDGVRVSPGEPGPLVASLVIESDAPGCRALRRELLLGGARGVLEIRDRLEKTLVREKESVHIAFPFLVPEGTVRLDVGWGFVRPGVDQIAGACRDYFCVPGAADVSNADHGVTLLCRDAPLIEVGAMTDESPVARGLRAWRAEVPPGRTLYSYAMNNYWHTNYRADQEGVTDLEYALRPHAGFDPAETRRLALESESPLVVIPAAPGPEIRTLLEVGPTDVLVTSVRPAEGGAAWRVRLYNASGEPRRAGWKTATGDAGEIALQPLQTAEVRVPCVR